MLSFHVSYLVIIRFILVCFFTGIFLLRWYSLLSLLQGLSPLQLNHLKKKNRLLYLKDPVRTAK